MAWLSTLVELGDDGPGLLLPVFKSWRGANQDLVQSIAPDGRIADFEEFVAPHGLAPPGEIERQVGDSALWAFRAENDEISVFDDEHRESVVLGLLRGDWADRWPLVAADLVLLGGLTDKFGYLLARAFEALKRNSPDAAKVWRDAVVLLPALRQDLVNLCRKEGRPAEWLDQVMVISSVRTCYLYMPKALLPSRGNTLNEVASLGMMFGIDHFVYRDLSDSRPSAPLAEALLVGVGGVARRALNSAPFYGYGVDADSTVDVATALLTDHPGRQLLIAVCGSERVGLQRIQHEADRSGADTKHLLLVRPIGFGKPSPSRPSPVEVVDTLRDFDFIWSVGAHRIKRLEVRAPNLAASSLAARTVRRAATILANYAKPLREALRETRRMREGAGEDEPRRAPLFGVAGLCQWRREVSELGMVRRALCSLLNSDLNLTSAPLILMYWPVRPSTEGVREVELGPCSFRVKLVPYTPSRRREVVSFALDMQPMSVRDGPVFIDYCLMLLFAYGWRSRSRRGHDFTMVRGGRQLRVIIGGGSSVPDEESSVDADASELNLMILQATPEARERAALGDRGWNLISVAELDLWMRHAMNVELFETRPFV